MPTNSLPGPPDPESSLHVLVCGRCEEILGERFESVPATDEAADEHALETHPDDEAVVILPASFENVQERPDEIIEAASRAQAEIDRERLG